MCDKCMLVSYKWLKELVDVDVTSESTWDKEFQVEGYIVIQDYDTRETIDRYKFSKIYKN